MFNTNANTEKIRKHNRVRSEGQEMRMLRARAKKNQLTRRDYDRLAEEKYGYEYKIAA